MSHFYVFYPHGMSLVEQLLYELRSMSLYAIPDPTLADTQWTGLIILNRDSPLLEKWEYHFRRIERLMHLKSDDPEVSEIVQDMNNGTLALLSEDKDAIRIIQHWERWDWRETADILRKKCGIRLNGTPLRKPLSEQQEMALEDYLSRSINLASRTQQHQFEKEKFELLQQKFENRIKLDEKFLFTMRHLQA